ncbi:MAG: IS4 family transposase [Methanobacteriaceae archaeon]
MLASFFPDLQNLIRNKKQNFILAKNKFSRKRKTDLETITHYILGNKGKTTVLELIEFFNIKNGDDSVSITKQNLSQQRSYLDPTIFKCSNANTLKKVYSSTEYPLKTHKGLFVLAADGSQLELPNTQQTREEFDVPLRALKKTDTPKARISVISDVKNDFIIDSTINTMSVGEHRLAYENIENTSEIIDLKKAIIVFDRLYASTELFMQLSEKQSHFIFRLKKSIYKKERKKMKTDDEWVDIRLTSNRTQKIKNKALKEKAEQTNYLNLRIVNIPLETGKIETLITNLTENIASPQELKEIYGERWQIEKGYDVLKNKIHIENFSGKRKIIIEQDFYSQILMYNILIDFKTECNQKIEKTKEHNNSKYKYQVNINILAGKLKMNLLQQQKKKEKS